VGGGFAWVRRGMQKTMQSWQPMATYGFWQRRAVFGSRGLATFGSWGRQGVT